MDGSVLRPLVLIAVYRAQLIVMFSNVAHVFRTLFDTSSVIFLIFIGTYAAQSITNWTEKAQTAILKGEEAPEERFIYL